MWNFPFLKLAAYFTFLFILSYAFCPHWLLASFTFLSFFLAGSSVITNITLSLQCASEYEETMVQSSMSLLRTTLHNIIELEFSMATFQFTFNSKHNSSQNSMSFNGILASSAKSTLFFYLVLITLLPWIIAFFRWQRAWSNDAMIGSCVSWQHHFTIEYVI